MEGTVSILIPVFNARPWVARAIASALEQTWPDKEVIALDDGSTDGSWDVLQEFKSRIRVEKAPRNGGQNISRNALTRMSHGEWLVYLDADDELAPEAVAQKMSVADGVDAVYGTMEVRYYDGTEVTSAHEVRAEKQSEPLDAAFLWKYPNTSSFMFRKSAVEAVGGWNESIQNCTDYDLYFRLLIAGRTFAAAADSLTIYRHWSLTQAVYENLSRKTLTRLELMWRSVLKLEAEGRLTPHTREAFGNSALAVIRTVHSLDPSRAAQEHRRLRLWHPHFVPSAEHFPAGYRRGYSLLGFRAAESLAALTRFLRPAPPEGLRVPASA